MSLPGWITRRSRPPRTRRSRAPFPRFARALCVDRWSSASPARHFRSRRADRRVPGPVTRLKGFYLAGDWTDTGLPGTIEGAVRSGYAAADAYRG